MRKAPTIVVTAAAIAALMASGPPAGAAEPDVVAPTVTSTGLRDGQLLPAVLNFTPVMSDDVAVTKVQLILNGRIVNTYFPSSSSWMGRMQVSPGKALHDQDVDITVRAFDQAGNHGEATTRVHVDCEVPRATITPTSETKVGGTVTFTVTEASPDLASLSVYDDRSNLLARTTGTPWIATWDSRPQNRMFWGEYVIRDRAGNVDSSYALLDVDNAGPLIDNVRFPVIDGRVGGRARSVVASVIDYTAVQRVEWWIDGALHATELNPGDDATLHWDTGAANGTAELEIRAYDVFGAVSTLDRTVTIDNRAPAISATPADKALLRTGFTTTAKAADSSGIGAATLTVDGGKHGRHTVPTAPFTQRVTTRLSDGRHTLSWSIPDKLGNIATVSRQVTVDNTGATLKIKKAPRNGAKVKKRVTVTAAAADRNGVRRVEVLINGKVVATDTRAGYAFTITLKKAYGKKIRMRVRAYDNAGNATNTTTRTWRR